MDSSVLIIIFIVLILVIAGGGYYYTKNKQNSSSVAPAPVSTPTPSGSPVATTPVVVSSTSSSPPPPPPPPQAQDGVIREANSIVGLTTFNRQYDSNEPIVTFSQSGTSSQQNINTLKTRGFFPVRAYMDEFKDSNANNSVEACQKACDDLGCIGWEYDHSDQKCMYNDINKQPLDQFNFYWSGINILQSNGETIPSAMIQGNLVDEIVNPNYFPDYDKIQTTKTDNEGICQQSCAVNDIYCNVWTYRKTTDGSPGDCTFYKNKTALEKTYGISRKWTSDPLKKITNNYHITGLGGVCKDIYSCSDNLTCRSTTGGIKFCLQNTRSVKESGICVDSSECVSGLECNFPTGKTSGPKICSLGTKIGKVEEGSKCYTNPINCEYPSIFTCSEETDLCTRQPFILPNGKHMIQTEFLEFTGKQTSAKAKLELGVNGSLIYTSDTSGMSFTKKPVNVINSTQFPQSFMITPMDNGDLVFSIYKASIDPTTSWDSSDQKTEVRLWALGPSSPIQDSDIPIRYEISDVGLSLKKSTGVVIFTYPTDTTKYKIDVYSEDDITVNYDKNPTNIPRTIKSKVVTKVLDANSLRDLMNTTGATCGVLNGETGTLYFKTSPGLTFEKVDNTITIVRNPTKVSNIPKNGVCMTKDNCSDGLDCLVSNVQLNVQRCLSRAECAKFAFDTSSDPEPACRLADKEQCIKGYDCTSGKCSANYVCIPQNTDCITNDDCTGEKGVCDTTKGKCVGQPLNNSCSAGVNDCFEGLTCAPKSGKCIKSEPDACYNNDDCIDDASYCNPGSKKCEKIPVGNARNCVTSANCDNGTCAVSTKTCITLGTCSTSEDCSGATNWCDSSDKTCKAPMDTFDFEKYKEGQMHMNGTNVVCLISQNGKWALMLRTNTDLIVYARDPSTGAIDENNYKWHSWTYNTGVPANMEKARLRFDKDLGGLYVDYYNTVRKTWIQLFEQINSGYLHNNLDAYKTDGDPYNLFLTNDGDLNITKRSNGTIVWSSTGNAWNGKSFHALRQMGYVQGDSVSGWIDFPNTNDYAASIQQLMNTANGTASYGGFVVDYRETRWKYKIITTSGSIYPNTTGHTYLKNQKDNWSRVNYIEYDTGVFDFTNGRNLLTNTLEYSGLTSPEECANKSIINGASRGFMQNPTNGDCWVVGDTAYPQFAVNYTYPMPTGNEAGYNAGWKKTQGPKSSAQTPAWIQQLQSPDGTFLMQCGEDGNIVISKPKTVVFNGKTLNLGRTITYSTRTWGHTGCKLYLDNKSLTVRTGTGRIVWRSSYTDYDDTTKVLILDDNGLLSYKNKVTGATVWNHNMEINSATTNPDWIEITNLQNGDARLVMQGDGNLVVYMGNEGGSVWQTYTYGRPNARAYLFKSALIVRDDVGSYPAVWASRYSDGNGNGNPWYNNPPPAACLQLNNNGTLDIFPNNKDDPNKIWSSWSWAPRNYHVARGKASGSAMFRIRAVFLSGTTTVSQNDQCLGVPGTPADHAPVYFYSDTTPLSKQAQWKLYPVTNDAGTDGRYYIVLAANTDLVLHRWGNNDNDICLRILSQDRGNNSQWWISWDTANEQTCRIRPIDNGNKALNWTNSNINGSRAYLTSATTNTGPILNLSW